MKPLICAPMGDPAGVGPEILAASLADAAVTDMANVLVVGNTEIMRRAAAIMKVNLDFNEVDADLNGWREGAANIINMDNVDLASFAYGKVQALSGLNLTVGGGEIVSLLGNNGAGKSTTVSTISGVVRSQAGSISAFGQDITRATPWSIVESGVIQVPEGRRIFSRLTVHENLQLGGYSVKDTALIDQRIAEVYDLLRASRTGCASRVALSPAASSRCWPSDGR